MSRLKLEKYRKKLAKKNKRGYQGHPVVTIAFYGSDDKLATKASVGIIETESSDAYVERFLASQPGEDVRNNADVLGKILQLIDSAEAKSVTLIEAIIGCPHEQGVDYQEDDCPQADCQFWIGKDPLKDL